MLYEKAIAAGWPVYPSYGMSETSAQLATYDPADGPWQPGLVGKALTGSEIAIGTNGRIRVRGQQLMLGYLDGSEEVPAHDRAVMLVAMKLGTLVLAGHLERNFGIEPFTPAYNRRTGAAMLELLNPHLVADDIMTAARDASRPSKEGHS